MSNIDPDHYTLASGRQACDVIGDICDTLESRGLGGAEIYYVGSALKYLTRLGAKGDQDEQIRKAIRFLQMALPAQDQTSEEKHPTPAEIAVDAVPPGLALIRDLCLTGAYAAAVEGQYGPDSSDFGDFDD